MISSHTLEKIIKHNCWVDCETSKITFLDSPSVFNIEPFVQFKEGNYGIGKIGAYTFFNGGNLYIKNVSEIGRYCSIARDVSIGAVEHPTDCLSTHHILMGSYYPDNVHIKKYI